MKKSSKTLIALILVGILLFSMTACDKDTGTEVEDTKTSAPAKTEEKVTEDAEEMQEEMPIDTSEHQVISFLTLGNKPTNGRMEAAVEKLNEILTDEVNAEVELMYVEWADWQTQYNLVLASGDSSLDLIGTATDWLNAWENTKKGSFMPLPDEMIQTYAPKTWAQVPESHWNECRYEGTIYFFPEDQYTQWTNHGMFYRGDWAAEAGLDDIMSFEDLETYFDGVLANHPNVVPWDAAGKTHLEGLAGFYTNAYTDYFIINGIAAGIFGLFYVSQDDPYTVVCPYTEGTTLEDFAVMMDRWADKGFWREDVLNYEGETRELFYAGQSGADQHHTQTFVTGITNNMNEKQPGSDPKFYPFCATSENLVRDIVTHGACAVGANSDNAERALMVYDIIRNEEAPYRLFNYGIEGVDYLVTDDGKLARPEGWDGSTDGLGIDYWWGRNDDLELADVNHYDKKQDIYDEFDRYAIDYPLGKFIFDKSSSETLLAALGDVCATHLPTIAWGKTSDPVTAVADFRAALESAGLQDMLDEIQTQLDEYKMSE
jgi:maltose-binding protein MalE